MSYVCKLRAGVRSSAESPQPIRPTSVECVYTGGTVSAKVSLNERITRYLQELVVFPAVFDWKM